MSTARVLIKDAMRLIGVLASGENPSADEQSDALRSLNRMLENWSNERFIIHTTPKRSVSLVSGQGVYTVGAGGDFDFARPQRIEFATITQAGDDSEIPVEVINFHEWQQLAQKSTTSTIPTKLYMEGLFPLDNAHLYPVPSAACTLNLYLWEPLVSITNASEEISLPPGYEDTLVYNLAKRLAPEFGVGVPNEVAMEAMTSKEKLRRKNTISREIGSNPLGNPKRYNVRTGQ